MTPGQRSVAEKLAKWHQAMADEPNRNGAKKEKHAITAALLRELAQEPPGEPVQEPVATLHDDGYWTPKQSEAGRRLNDQLMRAGTRVDVYTHPPQQRKPLTTAMEAEIECDCLVAWNASTYGHSKHDTVHPMFLSAFIRGYRAAECAHGIGEAP